MTQELTFFYNSGKTFLGYVVKFTDSDENISIPGVGEINADSEYYAIISPCAVDFQLKEADEKSSTPYITWKSIMPLIPGKLVNAMDANEIYFAFDKAGTVMSNVTKTKISNDIIKAYNALTGVTL